MGGRAVHLRSSEKWAILPRAFTSSTVAFSCGRGGGHVETCLKQGVLQVEGMPTHTLQPQPS